MSRTTSLRIADLVDVLPAETVVRLDGTSGRLRELELTGDVVRSLGAVLERAQGETGAGFLVVGHFGSGKSHFLAALGELLAEPSLAPGLAGWDSRLRALAASARPSLVVPVPLVEYRADASLEDVVWRRAWQALGKPGPAITTDRVESSSAQSNSGRPAVLSCTGRSASSPSQDRSNDLPGLPRPGWATAFPPVLRRCFDFGMRQPDH